MTSRSLLSGILAAALMSLAMPIATGAGSATLALEPHCTETDRTTCKLFAVVSADHLSTDMLKVGDLVDIDVVITNAVPGSSVRSWLNYDASIIEARSVELTSAMASAIPGEQNFDAATGIVKIGGTLAPNVSLARTAIARVTFRIKSAVKNSDISFVSTQETEKLLAVHPSALTVAVTASAASSSTSMQPNGYMPVTDEYLAAQNAQIAAMQNMSSSTSSAPTGSSSFPLLQIQNLRVTSQDSTIFVGWDKLLSSELTGYNVYYGTVSGKYIQRRSVPAATPSLVLRDLEKGTVYYVAVRGYNAANAETTFSREVSVEVGNPSTSTSPLAGGFIEPSPDGNPVENHGGSTVSGSTGMGSGILVILAVCAVVGTAFAAHRQLKISHLAHRI